MSKDFRIIHISDIHLGQDDIALHDDVRNQMIRDAQELSKEIGNADAIAISGDTAYSGKRVEYERAGEWLGNLCEAVGCGEDSVYITPGNHDINLDECTPLVENIHDLLIDATDDSLEATISTYLHNDSKAENMLLAKLSNYFEFANRYGRYLHDLWKKPLWVEDVARLDSLTLRFVGINTVLFSGKQPNQKGRLVLGRNQYILPEDDGVEYVIMFHHPLDWCKDGNKARGYLENRARVWLVGHEHNLRVESATNVGCFKRLEVHAGATNPAAKGSYEFRYNWLAFTLDDLAAEKQLVVTLWPRVWTTPLARFMADQNLLRGDSSREFRFSLSKHDAIPNEGYVKASEGQSTKGQVDANDEDNYLSEVDIDMFRVEREDQDFRRLQFLFWKKLKRGERLIILVELGLLPDLGDTLTPDWIRHGLEIARNTEKLYELWESMMSYIPPEKREANPFPYHEEEKG